MAQRYSNKSKYQLINEIQARDRIIQDYTKRLDEVLKDNAEKQKALDRQSSLIKNYEERLSKGGT